MSTPEFCWCDLSTFDTQRARQFYAATMGWTFAGAHEAVGWGDDYHYASLHNQTITGIYTMPDFFQSIQMPSFWMSYLQVTSIESIVEQAEQLGAKCEIPPTDLDAQSRFALIRDPSGAGFTLYESPAGFAESGSSQFRCRYELQVDSIDQVRRFHETLFDWKLESDSSWPSRYRVTSAAGEPVASVLEIDPAEKGPKNYWCVIFVVPNTTSIVDAVTKRGGQVIMDSSDTLDYVMLEDDQGAMFCVTQG